MNVNVPLAQVKIDDQLPALLCSTVTPPLNEKLKVHVCLRKDLRLLSTCRLDSEDGGGAQLRRGRRRRRRDEERRSTGGQHSRSSALVDLA